MRASALIKAYVPTSLLLALSLAASAQAQIETHAHLFMKEGMGTFATGEFFDKELSARDYRSRFGSQANVATLNASGLQLVVATLYAHPVLARGSLRDSIRHQIDQAERFVRENPQWVIARSASKAELALAKGKRVLVLALEGASGIIDNEDDLREFVDGRGVHIVTFLHLTDDHLGGVAFLRGVRALSSPLAWMGQLFRPLYDPDGVRINRNGLTDEGRKLAKEMIRRKVWIDLAHSSDASQAELVPMLLAAGQPLLYTHTSPRKWLRAERGITASQLEAVGKSGGFVGIMPALDMLEGTPSECGSGIEQLIEHHKDVASRVGAENIAIGSDTNGGVEHLPPDTCKNSLLPQGYWRIDQAPALWEALRRGGASVPIDLNAVTRRFVAAWKRVSG